MTTIGIVFIVIGMSGKDMFPFVAVGIMFLFIG